ncbi:MAG: hypothetical protein QXM68_02390 [Candidatus Aenigmatarchaeota archaeon]|nr:hypothetical protein [Candidatus Aenigmarchaeota archaeon]
MKSKVYETIVEMLNEIKKNNSEELKKLSSITNHLSKEIESHKTTFQQINSKVLRLEQEIDSLKKAKETQDNHKKVLSNIVYDFENMKNKLERQISLVENKTIILESKINMNKGKQFDITPLINSVNELKDVMSLNMKAMNAKINEVFKRYESIEIRQKIIEKLLDISTSADEINIRKGLDELSELTKKLKDLDNFDEKLQQTIYKYLDSVAFYMQSNGLEEIANFLRDKRTEIV